MRRKYIQRTILIVWLIILISFWVYSLSHSEFMSAEYISDFILKFETHFLIVYSIMFILRPFVLLPGATYVIVGSLLFNNLELVLLISVLCEIISSTIIYYFSSYLGFDDFFKKKYAKKMKRLKIKLESKTGFVFMLAWSSFPFVPSDLLFYVAGSLHINYKKFILAVFTGHIVLYGIYVYFTDSVLRLL